MNSGAETGEATCDERRMYRGRAGRWAVNNRLGLGVGDLCNRRCMYVHVSGAAVLLWPQTLTRAKLEVLEEEILLPVSDDEVLVCPLVDNKLSRLKQNTEGSGEAITSRMFVCKRKRKRKENNKIQGFLCIKTSCVWLPACYLTLYWFLIWLWPITWTKASQRSGGGLE